MDYGEAIQVLERANEKFEFPVNWGVDLESEHERYLTEKYAKKPVIVMKHPKAIKAQGCPGKRTRLKGCCLAQPEPARQPLAALQGGEGGARKAGG